MTDEQPSKADINAVFKKLRALAANKICFDCAAKNPTWASVTYGVFICIDCSAIHRGLGVHLSFVRSTQLDTNWTWLQLRAMQVGGNFTATQFFSQHGCTSKDSHEKYRSRVAHMYREKLHQLAVSAMRLHGYKVMIDTHCEPTVPNEKETDFFDEHTKNNENSHNFLDTKKSHLTHTSPSNIGINEDAYIGEHLGGSNKTLDDAEYIKGPSVNHLHMDMSNNKLPTSKSAFGQKKPTAKKSAFGAQKVIANFSEIEKQAENFERLKLATPIVEPVNTSASETTSLSSRLMVQEVAKTTAQAQEKLKVADPKKYQQAERLGMGFTGGKKADISHSAINDITSINQEGERFSSSNVNKFDNKSSFSVLANLSDDKWGKIMVTNTEDDWQLIKSGKEDTKSTTNETDDFFDSFNNNKKPAGFSDSKTTDDNCRRSKVVSKFSAVPSSEDLTKKFSKAKAISSDQFFGSDRGNDFESKAGMSRFQGQSSISSSEYFGREETNNYGGRFAGLSNTDVSDIKDSVKQGVSKVAGKLSQLSSSVSSYISNK